jgi:hypothetical protein
MQLGSIRLVFVPDASLPLLPRLHTRFPSLCLTVPHCASLCSPCLAMPDYASLCLAMPDYASLCHFVSGNGCSLEGM